MEAQMLLQSVVEGRPEKVAGWHNLGKVRMQPGKVDRARAAFFEAKLGRSDAAEAAYRRGMDLGSEHARRAAGGGEWGDPRGVVV